MSGSKNTELTVKYVCRSLATTSRGLRMIVLVAYSTNPMNANRTASTTTSSMHRRISPAVPLDAAQQHEHQRERHVEEHHLL